MHIAEGFLPPFWAIFWWLTSLPFIIYGVWKTGKIFKKHPEYKLTLAVSGAFIFVLSSLKLPSVTGSSSHPTGTGLAAVLFGPGVTALLSFIVLIFQALLLAHGGITTLGADVFSMGIVGPFTAYLLFRALRALKASLNISVFIAAVISDWITYVVTSLQLALAYPAANGILGSFTIFLGVFAIAQIPLAVAEGILIVIFFDYLKKSRPKLAAKLLGKLK
ncbi:TPA: energy-coupling factor ABC transporter permease [Candidatus Woesearchaeota archaeon]|nr:energy-coupling factor ABC transporter permease [Candidatus Woesearchaeota archaeon]